MRIETVRTHVLDHELETPFASATMRFGRRTHVLVEITCDDGITGWGECLGPALPNAAIVEAYAPWLIGADPLETERIWLTLYNALRDQGQRGLTVTALSGIDIALWDIKGKRFGVPISTLLGGRFRQRVRAYATGSFKRDGVDRLHDNVSEVARHKAEGFAAAKIKIGFDVEDDLAILRAVRKEVGPDMRLMVDANHGYDVLEAISFGRRAVELDVDWFEEPVTPEQLAGYHAVRAGQPIPVAGGETWHTRWGMREPIETRAVDIIQPDLAGTGGFTEARRIADLAALHNVRLIPHVWGTAVHIAAALQFMAALPPSPPRETPRDPILEFDRTHNPFRQAIVADPLTPTDGVVAIPDGPGLGIEINRDALDHYRLKTS